MTALAKAWLQDAPFRVNHRGLLPGSLTFTFTFRYLLKTKVLERSGIGAETPFAIGLKTALVLSNETKKRPETSGAESRHDQYSTWGRHNTMSAPGMSAPVVSAPGMSAPVMSAPGQKGWQVFAMKLGCQQH